MIIGVWSPVSVNEKNISSIQIDMSAKALASPIIGHRGHPGKAERRHLMWHKNLLCSFKPLSSRRTKLLVPGWLRHPARSVPVAAARPRVVFSINNTYVYCLCRGTRARLIRVMDHLRAPWQRPVTVSSEDHKPTSKLDLAEITLLSLLVF